MEDRSSGPIGNSLFVITVKNLQSSAFVASSIQDKVGEVENKSLVSDKFCQELKSRTRNKSC